MKTTVKLRESGVVWVVTIDRADKKNAVDRETAQQLAKAFRRFDDDHEARVAVLTSTGPDFCSGADLKAIAAGRGNRVELDGDGPMGPTRMRLTKPVIAAIEGHAVAGGLELALWCDLRVASLGATFGVFCRRFGVPLIDGGTFRLPRLIGMSRALDLILTGRSVTAKEAFSFGLVNRVVATGQAEKKAVELANEIARFPQECMRIDLASAHAQEGLSESEAVQQEFERGLPLLDKYVVRGAVRFAEGEGRHGTFDVDSD